MPAPIADVGLFAVPFPPVGRSRRRARPAPAARLIPADADSERALAEHHARRRHPSGRSRGSSRSSRRRGLRVVR